MKMKIPGVDGDDGIELILEQDERKMIIGLGGEPDEVVSNVAFFFKDKDDNYIGFDNKGKESEDISFNLNKDQTGFLIDFLKRIYDNME